MLSEALQNTLTLDQSRRLSILDGKLPGSLMIHEIYASIQGESTYAGLPCSFVRLSGCHLRCVWCDTPHAFGEGSAMTVPEIVDAVSKLSPRLVEITGGEPLAQPEVLGLMTTLADRGFKVLLETAGALPTQEVDPRVTIILDLKCPGSGENEANHWPNLDSLKPIDEAKFVIADRVDFDWAVDVVRKHDLTRFAVLFAPVFGKLDYEKLCQWIIETGLPIRFQIQQHKHIWHPKARGV